MWMPCDRKSEPRRENPTGFQNMNIYSMIGVWKVFYKQQHQVKKKFI